MEYGQVIINIFSYFSKNEKSNDFTALFCGMAKENLIIFFL